MIDSAAIIVYIFPIRLENTIPLRKVFFDNSKNSIDKTITPIFSARLAVSATVSMP